MLAGSRGAGPARHAGRREQSQALLNQHQVYSSMRTIIHVCVGDHPRAVNAGADKTQPDGRKPTRLPPHARQAYPAGMSGLPRKQCLRLASTKLVQASTSNQLHAKGPAQWRARKVRSDSMTRGRMHDLNRTKAELTYLLLLPFTGLTSSGCQYALSIHLSQRAEDIARKRV